MNLWYSTYPLQLVKIDEKVYFKKTYFFKFVISEMVNYFVH